MQHAMQHYIVFSFDPLRDTPCTHLKSSKPHCSVSLANATGTRPAQAPASFTWTQPGHICPSSQAACPGASVLTFSMGRCENVPEHVTRMAILRSWGNPLSSSLTSPVKATVIGRTVWRLLSPLPSPFFLTKVAIVHLKRKCRD